ncbi:MAG: hypothetical protein RLZZ281_1209 [Pseudomonadota bacterium]|jgi:uncharacterized MAPEG superfamily protein
MSTALWCLLIAGLMPIICAGISKWGASDFDNASPREWLARQEGHRKRANAAQANSWEAFALFSTAVLVALHNNVDAQKLDNLAVFFIVSRVLFIAFYLMNRSTLRSLAWLAGLFTTLTIFASGA